VCLYLEYFGWVFCILIDYPFSIMYMNWYQYIWFFGKLYTGIDFKPVFLYYTYIEFGNVKSSFWRYYINTVNDNKYNFFFKNAINIKLFRNMDFLYCNKNISYCNDVWILVIVITHLIATIVVNILSYFKNIINH